MKPSFLNITAAALTVGLSLGTAAGAADFDHYNGCTANALVFTAIVKKMQESGTELPTDFVKNSTTVAAAFTMMTLDLGKKNGIDGPKVMASEIVAAKNRTKTLIDDKGATEAFKIIAQRHQSCLETMDQDELRKAIARMKQ